MILSLNLWFEKHEVFRVATTFKQLKKVAAPPRHSFSNFCGKVVGKVLWKSGWSILIKTLGWVLLRHLLADTVFCAGVHNVCFLQCFAAVNVSRNFYPKSLIDPDF